MKIGIDISQIAYKTGVSNYLLKLVENMVKLDSKNEYILFFSSLRRNFQFSIFNFSAKGGSASGGQLPDNVKIKTFRIPPSLLNIIWNRLHILPIENFVGPVDMFITSDWTEPPVKKAKKATIIYDLLVYKYPNETHAKTEFSLKNLILRPNIVDIQKRKLKWVTQESDFMFTISESSKKDIVDILKINPSKIKVIHPGV